MPLLLTPLRSCDPKHPPAPNSHSSIDRRNTPKPTNPLRWRPISKRARASRVRIHSRQPAIRVPRMETRDVRSTRPMARCTSRVDQGRRRARFLHAWTVVLESSSEFLRRAVVLGGCRSLIPPPFARPPLYHALLLTHHKKTGCTQSHPNHRLAERASAGPPSREHVGRRIAYPRATVSLACAVPAFHLFDAFHRVCLSWQVPARLRRVSLTRRDVRAPSDTCLGRPSQFDRRET